MRALLDTSVLVAALVEAHPRHADAFPWLEKLRRDEVEGAMAAHSMAEAYAVLSTLPVRPRIAPSAAWALLEHSILPFVETIHLTEPETRRVVERVSRQGLAGGVVEDALIAECGVKASADCILTLNTEDFRRIAVDDTPEIREP